MQGAPASGVAARQASSTCANVPLQTSWQYVAPPGMRNSTLGLQTQGMEWATKTWRAKGSKKVRNLILTIPDGFGPASEVFARDFVQWNNTATGWNRQLGSDKVQIGSIRTRSTDSYVTDSSASATAYSCAIKTYNGAVGIDEDGNPCATVLEAAKRAGYTTGMVVTSRITHATPASFASHIYDREAEPTIAEQIVGDQPLGRVADLLLGGGLSMPNTTTGSSRKDGRDLLAEAKKAGFNVFTTRTGFDALKVDRDPAVEPSLLEMAKTALETLKQATKNTKQGFFIMIEASRIDHAAHANDPVGHLHEISCITKWYNPEPLAAAKHSSSYLASQWTKYNGTDPDGFLTDLFAQYGINDANSTEIAVAKANKGNTNFIDTHIGQAMGRRAMIKWGTGGHTAVDVNLIGYGPNIERMAGNRDNTEVGQFITDQLGLDLPSATNLLNDKKNEKWLVEKVGRDKVEKGVRNLRKQHGHQHD
ncbi:Alkaline phosphatase [Rhizoctonia solani]|uniref:Alkaline phosphatase n=1 Tax=Rhizoctonia solani TaxID=456999 RepID=A0A8H7IA88_9AGAM|nr:Alkaline phosphatase [Rhizoctonia solani]